MAPVSLAPFSPPSRGTGVTEKERSLAFPGAPEEKVRILRTQVRRDGAYSLLKN